MTCKEKLRLEHPEWGKSAYTRYCPHHFGYAGDPGLLICGPCYCEDCWNREAVGNSEKKQEAAPEFASMSLIDEICAARQKLVNGGFSDIEAYDMITMMFESRFRNE